jgi:CDP-glycerol glycerophosphotransferase (TagB/SpsB family)
MSRWIKGGLEFTENIKNNILQSENAILDDDDEYHSKLKCGDAFIVDASSLAVEVGALNKPVIYMKSLEHPIEINEVYKPLIESYIQGKTCNDIVNFLKDCEKGLDINQDVRANSFKSVIPYYDGKSAERIRDNLIYSLENDL